MIDIVLGGMMSNRWRHYDLDEWTDNLQGVCGHFHSKTVGGNDLVTGLVEAGSRGGLDMTQVATNLHSVSREVRDVRADHGENMFLLLQIEGRCGVEQMGRQVTVSPGECVLVDSAYPSIFHFDGRFSNHLSVHLPRELLCADRARHLEPGRRVAADDPMALVLGGLVVKLVNTEQEAGEASRLRQLLFGAVRQAFGRDWGEARTPCSELAQRRVEIVQVLIDRHLTDERLTPQWLADRVGISLRTLQNDYAATGTTLSAHIRNRRLLLARDQLMERKRQGRGRTISEVAYASGFNDISYFNRCFRQAFAQSPRDLLSG